MSRWAFISLHRRPSLLIPALISVAQIAAVLHSGGALAQPKLAQTNSDQAPPPAEPEPDDFPRGSSQAIRRARELVVEGDELMRGGDFIQGTARYKQAFSIHPSYFTACKAGRGDAQLKRHAEAATLLSYCLKHFTLAADDKQKTAEKRYRELYEEVLAKVGHVSIQILPKHATVQLNEVALDPELFSGEAFTPPGTHTLSVSAEGFETARAEFTVGEGESLTLSFDLTLRVEDTKPPGAQPEAPSPAKASGSTPALTLDVRDAPPPEPNYLIRNISVLSGAGLAAGAIVASFIFRHNTQTYDERIQTIRTAHPNTSCTGSQAPHCVTLQELGDDRATQASLTNISLGVGVGLGVASIAAFFLWPEPSPPASSNTAQLYPLNQPSPFELQLGPRGSKFTVSGTF